MMETGGRHPENIANVAKTTVYSPFCPSADNRSSAPLWPAERCPSLEADINIVFADILKTYFIHF